MSSARGSYYRKRTADWYAAKGYHVLIAERMFWGGGFAVKKDQLGADLVVFNDHETVCLQVKGGLRPKDQVAAAVREFRKYGIHAGQLIVCWQKGAREPEIIDAKTYEIRGDVGPLLREPPEKPSGKPKKEKAHHGAEFEDDSSQPLF